MIRTFLFWAALLTLLSSLCLYGYVLVGHVSSGTDVKVERPLVYLSQYSVKQGTPLTVFAESNQGMSGKIFRLEDKRKEMHKVSIPATQIAEKVHFDYAKGFDLESVHVLDTSSFPTGYYILEASTVQGDYAVVPFVVNDPDCAGIQIVASTYTWLAYNSFVHSNYVDERPWNKRKSARLAAKFHWYVSNIAERIFSSNSFSAYPYTQLPYLKPVVYADDMYGRESPEYGKYTRHLTEIEWDLVEFLELNDLDYCVMGNGDFSKKQFNMSNDIYVFSGHSEYWSDSMLEVLDELIFADKKILFTSGNNMYRKVEEYDSGITVVNQSINPAETTARIGSFYSAAGYQTFAPMDILVPSHWVFNGVDSTSFGHRSWNSEGLEVGNSGISGAETDKVNEYSEDFIVLAKGRNLGGLGGADMMYRQLENDGWIINFSSVAFNSGIHFDKNVQKILMNILTGSGQS